MAMMDTNMFGNDFNTIHFVMTPAMKGLDLDTFMRKAVQEQKKLPDNWDMLVAFQVAQALSVLQNFNVRHNDLHPGNVFIEEFAEEQEIKYSTPEAFVLKTRYKVTIFDFDQGALPAIRNTLLDSSHCESLGQCNEFVQSYDWYTFLVYFIDVLKRTQKISNSVFPNPIQIIDVIGAEEYKQASVSYVTKDSAAYFGRPCICKETSQNNLCVRCELKKDFLAKMKPPSQFVHDFISDTKNENTKSKPGLLQKMLASIA